MVIAGRSHTQAQQTLILVHALDDRQKKEQKLCVFIRRVAGAQEIDAGIGGHGPVVMLTAAVDTRKGLFMQQTHETVPAGDLLHDLHGELVVVRRDVGHSEDRRELVLAGRDLVVLGLGIDAELPELLVQLLHEGLDPGLDRAEVVVLQLLALGRLRAEEGPPGVDQVTALEVHLPVYQKILLLRADVCHHALDLTIPKQTQHTQRLTDQSLHRTQQRRLFVQRLAAVGAESRRDAQRLFLDKSIGGRVPGGIASGLEGGPQAAGGEAGSVRLALDQLLAGKLHDHMAVRRG